MNFRTILLRLPNWVGDVVMASGLPRALRARFPAARLVVQVRGAGRRVLAGNPWVDDWVVSTRAHGLRALEQEARALAALGAEAALILPNSFASAWVVRRAGIPVRIGYRRDLRGPLLTHAFDRPRDERGAFVPDFMGRSYGRLLEALGADPAAAERMELFITPEERAAADALFRPWRPAPDEPLLAVNPGASYGASKCWPATRFAAVIDRWHAETGRRVLLLHGPGEEALIHAILAALEGPAPLAHDRMIPLDVLKPVVARCALLLTNDTGPRHYAAAFGVPCVVLMGPTDPRYTTNAQERARVLRAAHPCMPCHEPCCPLDHRCLRDLSVEQVLGALRELAGAAR